MKNNLEANTDLPAKELLRRAFNIKSVVYDVNIGELMYAPLVDLSDGKKITPPEGIEYAAGLKPYAVYNFIHHASLTALSCPSLREILSALPEDVARQICAVRWEHKEYSPNIQRHVFELMAYTGTLPENIKNEKVILDKKEYFFIPPFDPAVKKDFSFDPSSIVLSPQRKMRLD